MSQQLNKVAQVARTAAQMILQNGGETYRAEDSVLYIGRAFGYTTDVIAFPTGMTITMSDADGNSQTLLSRVSHRTIDLTCIDRVNAVVRALCAGELSVEESETRLREIRLEPVPRAWKSAFYAGGSAAMFAVMFGGTLFDALGALASGVFAFFLSNGLPFASRLNLLSDLVAGFAVALTAFTVRLLPVPGSADRIIVSGMMPFVPGLLLTNAIRDSMRGDLVSGSSRLGEAMMRAVLLTAGVGAAMAIWRAGGGLWK